MQRVIVRCQQGALYSSIWVPFGSLKAVRLGTTRLQRCPLHHKWERTSRVDPSTLTADEVAAATAVRDSGLP